MVVFRFTRSTKFSNFPKTTWQYYSQQPKRSVRLKLSFGFCYPISKAQRDYWSYFFLLKSFLSIYSCYLMCILCNVCLDSRFLFSSTTFEISSTRDSSTDRVPQGWREADENGCSLIQSINSFNLNTNIIITMISLHKP